MDLKKGLNEFRVKDRTVVDTIMGLTLKLWNINDILGRHLSLVLCYLVELINYVIVMIYLHI